MIRFAIIPFALVAIVYGCGARAEAATEFCPAVVDEREVSPVGATIGTAATNYSYALTASAPRVVNASMIADTDRGWFGWSVQDTAVPSTLLGVTFPEKVSVRHAWVVTANGQPCDVPSFPSASIADVLTRPAKTVATPGPAPQASAMSTASPAQAPFEMKTCLVPFLPASVARPVPPEPPDDAYKITHPLTALIEVSVDAQGKFLDARVYQTSGFPSFDEAARKAASISTYTGAISYCRAVGGTYIFRADIRPGR